MIPEKSAKSYVSDQKTFKIPEILTTHIWENLQLGWNLQWLHLSDILDNMVQDCFGDIL